jgi:hypothetical protein
MMTQSSFGCENASKFFVAPVVVVLTIFFGSVEPSLAQDGQNHCLTVTKGNNRNAFFKQRITNKCNKTLHVAWCEENQCGTRDGYFTDLATVKPGKSIPVDTVGNGVTYGSCVYPAAPRALPNGQFSCKPGATKKKGGAAASGKGVGCIAQIKTTDGSHGWKNNCQFDVDYKCDNGSGGKDWTFPAGTELWFTMPSGPVTCEFTRR